MAVKIATLLNKLLKDAGVKDDNPKLRDVLSITAEIDDELATAIENNPNYITIDNAKNHDGLKNYFYGKSLAGIDSRILKLAEENGLSDDDMNEIKAEKNTHTKLQMVYDKTKALIESKHKTPADKEQLIKEINKLNGDIAKKDADMKTAIKAAEDAAAASITEYAIDSFLASQKYANKELDVDTNVLTARTLLNQTLADKKAKVVRNGKELKLINAENPDLDYLENNKPVKFSDLATSVLANKKLLEVTPGSGKTPAQKTPIQTGDGNKGPKMDKVISNYDKQIAELQAAS